MRSEAGPPVPARHTAMRRLTRGAAAGFLVGFVVILWSVFSLATQVRAAPDEDRAVTLGPLTMFRAEVDGDIRSLSPGAGAAAVLLVPALAGAGAALVAGRALDRGRETEAAAGG